MNLPNIKLRWEYIWFTNMILSIVYFIASTFIPKISKNNTYLYLSLSILGCIHVIVQTQRRNRRNRRTLHWNNIRNNILVKQFDIINPMNPTVMYSVPAA